MARILLIAEPEERTSWLADALVGAGFDGAFTSVTNAADCAAALSRDEWDLIVCSGHHTVLPSTFAVSGVSYNAEGAPFIFVNDSYEVVAELAIRFGARVCLRRLGLEHLGRAIQQALADGARRAELRATREFERAQRRILEHIASGVPLAEILVEIVQLIEAQGQGMACTILLLDRERGVVHHGAAPSLPREFAESIDGLAIGPRAGSCGTAAYLKKRVVVEDIATDPYWEEYRHLVLPFGLRACWSSPIFGAADEVLGTFAVYYGELRSPSDRELTWVDRATHLASIAIVRDRAGEALHQSEARYRQIVDTAYEGVWLVDGRLRTVFVNQRMRELLGYSEGEMLGRSVFDFVHPDQRAQIEARVRQRSEDVSEQLEMHFCRKGGSDLWAFVATSTMRNDAGKVTGVLGMVTDITQLKHAAAAATQSESELRVFFDNATLGMALVDRDGRVVRSNPALERMLGYSADEFGHMTFEDLTYHDDVDKDLTQREALKAGQSQAYQVEKRFVKRDRNILWGRLTASLVLGRDGKPQFGVGMIEDITLHKQMEDRERLRSLVYNALSDIFFYLGVERDGGFRFLFVNTAFLRATGLSEERVLGQLVQQVIPQPSLNDVLASYRRAIVEKRTVTWHEVTAYPTGTKHGDVSVTPIFDSTGRCTNLVGTVHDITEHIEAQERIQEQAALLDRAKDAIIVRDMSGVVQYWNRAAERFYGHTSREAVGRAMQELIPHDPAPVEHAQRTLLDCGEWSGEFSGVTRSGKPITIEASWTLLRDERGKPKAIFAIHTDITGRRQLELQMTRTQRLESLGTLAGGIAHDFANILGAIIANVGLALSKLEVQEVVQECLEEIERASTKGADLVRQILTFSRERKPERRPIRLESVVLEALHLLRSTLPPGIEVRTRFAGDVPDVFADPTQLHQVVMNLVTNAVHAMSAAGGVLDLATEHLRVEAGAAATALLPGDYARLSVSDTGTGMDATTLERIFEPFYTTKGSGKGTGLGLSVVHGIVKGHEGNIDVRSTPGQGSVFTVDLPAKPTEPD